MKMKWKKKIKKNKKLKKNWKKIIYKMNVIIQKNVNYVVKKVHQRICALNVIIIKVIII